MNDDAGDDVLKAIGVLALIPVATLFTLSCCVFETWCALAIWRWFAPWPLPLTLVQATGMNIAVSLVVRQMQRGKDERSLGRIGADTITHGFIAPLIMLFAAWMLRFWL